VGQPYNRTESGLSSVPRFKDENMQRKSTVLGSILLIVAVSLGCYYGKAFPKWDKREIEEACNLRFDNVSREAILFYCDRDIYPPGPDYGCRLRIEQTEEDFRHLMEYNAFVYEATATFMQIRMGYELKKYPWWKPAEIEALLAAEKRATDMNRYWCALHGRDKQGKGVTYIEYAD